MSDLDPYMIRAHVQGFEDIADQYTLDSAHVRNIHDCELDIAYGEREGEVLDVFWPQGHSSNLPIHMFVHGGYWRANSKDDYSFVANTIVESGAIAIIVDYDLMPDFRMDVLVEQVRNAARWVRHNGEKMGGDPTQFTASGHSAGAHLASYLQLQGVGETEEPDTGVSRLLLLSGIYDLTPIRKSFLQDEISLTEEEANLWSPIACEGSENINISLAVGDLETAPFHQDMKQFETTIAAAKGEVSASTLYHEDHMTIVRSLGESGTECAELLMKCIHGEC